MPVVIGLVSQKGGTGKSTLARALGAVVAAGGYKLTIADLDPSQDTVVEWDKLRDKNRLGPHINVRGSKTTAQAISRADDDELLIVDMPSGTSRNLLDLAERADLLVQPTSGSLDELRPAVLFFHDLVRAGIPRTKLVLALSRTSSKEEEDAARAYLAKAGYEVLAGSLPERGAYRTAQNAGHAVTEVPQRALRDPAYDLMEALFERVGGQLEAAGKEKAKMRGGD
jgi:chromosome partitioning protein